MNRVFTFLAMFRRERQPGDLVFAVGFFLVALVAALVLPAQAKFLPGKTLVAQPGFWPAVGVGMMVVFGAVHLLATVNAPRLPGRLKEVLVWARSLEFVAWFTAYVLSVPILGYLPATLALALGLALRLGYRSARALGSAALFALAVVLIFRTGLGVRIPAGALYDHLPDGLRAFALVNL
ncbi:tripartite tricarboxylate transporter TctB family protein [Litorisediminicola beolgyonensis]|uniref:Tripartite tricarboxylate transporter TctB family protein n=1 Tax=Litorisediminicola beolgyonensis TaxID=1173614 RepID=A0ABW3ZLM7_9RHOB